MTAGTNTPDPQTDGLPFRCDVVHEGEAASVQPIGEMDLLAVQTISACVAQLRARGYRRMVIDLRGLSFMDSSGLRFLLDCDAEARHDGFSVAMIPGPPNVQRVFALTRTAERLPFIEP